MLAPAEVPKLAPSKSAAARLQTVAQRVRYEGGEANAEVRSQSARGWQERGASKKQKLSSNDIDAHSNEDETDVDMGRWGAGSLQWSNDEIEWTGQNWPAFDITERGIIKDATTEDGETVLIYCALDNETLKDIYNKNAALRVQPLEVALDFASFSNPSLQNVGANDPLHQDTLPRSISHVVPK